MNGPHDVGGRMGFGPVTPEPAEPVFHAAWEARALGLTLCAGAAGGWNIDESRHARESLRVADYATSSYYEIWIKGLETLLLDRGLVTADELAAGRALGTAAPIGRVLPADAVPAALARGGPTERAATAPARFAVGDRVRTRNLHPAGHTRLPGYARDKLGVVEAVRGAHVFPDAHAHGGGEQPAWLYTVVFDGSTLWGDDAQAGLTVSIDAWEPYLDHA